MSPAPAPQKVAILGGGAGALSAAFGLTEQPGWEQRYDITVYQQGWRLGGKGASGRNAAVGQRIEEHGLHVWAGFYENAFRVIRACYKELNRSPDAPLATWRDAFKPHNFITVEELVNGKWIHWNITLPTNPDVPGSGGDLPSPWGYVRKALAWMTETFVKHRHDLGEPALGGLEELPAVPGWLDTVVRDLETRLGAAAGRVGSLPFLQGAWKLASALPDDPLRHAPKHHRGILWLLDEFMRRLVNHLQDLTAGNDAVRRLLILMDFAAAHVRGLIADGVIFKGFAAIDDQEWMAWLRKHGASEFTLESPLVRGTYDYIFGFRQGDVNRPAVGAGTCVRGLMRLGFTSKGAIFWKMQAGMGDTVFTPLYQVLKKRGVKFRFFHRVLGLGLAPDRKSIATIRMGRQVTLKQADYNPLVNVKDLDCWPSAPLYEQIVDSEAQELKAGNIDLESYWTTWPNKQEWDLQAGRDFDLVVLGISLGALKDICADLVANNTRWHDMVEKVQTVQTQALQLWLTRDAAALGWKYLPTILTAYAEPLDTYADMSHLVPREDWPAGQVPASIAYFCGPMADADPPDPGPGFPAKERMRVRTMALDWLAKYTGHVWPDAVPPDNPQGLDFNLLVDLAGGAGLARFDAQYYRANVNPSDRYVISVPGSAQYRLRAGESGFTNLFLAGDWVRTGINAGCVEAAVMAGLQASRAISGHPASIPGETDQVPAAPPPVPTGPGWLARLSAAITEFIRRLVEAFHERFRPAPPPLPHVPAPAPYVEVGGEQVFCQPLKLEGVSFFGFILDADYATLRAACDKYLNHAGGRREYHPLLPRVMLGFADIRKAGCANPPDSDKGFMQEIDVAFWVPVVGGKRVAGVFIAETIAWFLPYVFVNNAWASSSGREIYGFAKEVGTFSIPSGPTDPAVFSADTLVLEHYLPQTQARGMRIATVRRTDQPALGRPDRPGVEARGAFEDFVRALTGGDGSVTLPGLGLVVEVFKFLTHHEVPFVFLKQFRDVANGRQACYQSVVEAPARLLTLRTAGRLPGTYEAEIRPYDSHPIAKELGLRGPGPALAAWYSEFDFIMENGNTV